MEAQLEVIKNTENYADYSYSYYCTADATHFIKESYFSAGPYCKEDGSIMINKTTCTEVKEQLLNNRRARAVKWVHTAIRSVTCLLILGLLMLYKILKITNNTWALPKINYDKFQAVE